MANDTIVDIYCHIFPDAFFQEMNRIAPRLGNIGARLRSVKKLFDLDARFREMDQFGDYREIISLPNPPIEDFAGGEVGLKLARIGNPGSPWPHAWLASAYGLSGDLDRAVAELAEARRLGGDAFSNIARQKAATTSRRILAPAVLSFFEATYLTGLRKAGMPEE